MPHDDGPETEPGDPGATDGEPNADELARRRAGRTGSGSSVSDRAAEDDTTPEEELFPEGSLAGDSKVTLKTLIKSGAEIVAKASMGSAGVPIKGTGFFDVEEEVTLLVRVLPGGIIPVPTHESKDDGTHKVKKWTLTQSLRPIHVQEAGSMYTREQVLEMFHEAAVPSATVSRLLSEDPAETA